jgi:tRNA(fMet)-specific endonuclease VapC
MSGYLLDTNIASHVIRGDRPEISARLAALPMSAIVLSAVTEAELRYGVARRGRPPALTERVRQFLLRVEVRDWDRYAAGAYAELRTDCERRGVSLAPYDMMIAAHAIAQDAILVTRDKAFRHAQGQLRIEDWTSS